MPLLYLMVVSQGLLGYAMTSVMAPIAAEIFEGPHYASIFGVFTVALIGGGAVWVAFERLYRDGLAYRTEALVNWCPGCRTSVSDLEVIPTPETGTLWSVR